MNEKLNVESAPAGAMLPAMRVPLSNGDVILVDDTRNGRNHKGNPRTPHDIAALAKAKAKRERKALQKQKRANDEASHARPVAHGCKPKA